MATYRSFVYDILETIKENFDDANVNVHQVIHWTNMVSNRLIYQRLQKSKTGRYLGLFTLSVVVSDQPDGKHVVLPEPIVDLDRDFGIDYLFYKVEGCNDEIFFDRTELNKKWALSGNPYTKPKANNPFFYRVDDKLHLLGIDCINVDMICAGLRTMADDTLICDLNTEMPLSSEQIETLWYQVMNKARFGAVVPRDSLNDGNSTKSVTQTPAQPVPNMPAREEEVRDVND